MTKIEVLEETVVILDNKGYYSISDELFEEVQKRKRNKQKQKERRQKLSYYFNKEIFKIITEKQEKLSAEEIIQILKDKGITKNPVTGAFITNRMINLRCGKMAKIKALRVTVENRKRLYLNQ